MQIPDLLNLNQVTPVLFYINQYPFSLLSTLGAYRIQVDEIRPEPDLPNFSN